GRSSARRAAPLSPSRGRLCGVAVRRFQPAPSDPTRPFHSSGNFVTAGRGGSTPFPQKSAVKGVPVNRVGGAPSLKENASDTVVQSRPYLGVIAHRDARLLM